MEIEEIYPPYLYSIKYDTEQQNEYYRLLEQWNDIEYILPFMIENQKLLNNPIWAKFSNPEEATRQVLEEAEDLEKKIDKLSQNTELGKVPDLDSHFKLLGGEFKYEMEYVPMKSYSPGRPPLLRLYAIKMAPNIYLITGGGIKLADTIQNSPGLKDHVIQNIKKVRTWLKENGISDSEDMIENDN